MSKLTADQIRQKFIDFYCERGHKESPNVPLLPENDSSLLFTNSGMFPLVPYILGEKNPLGTRLVNSQKCIRTDEFDEIGDRRHISFFEMLGNWSLNDYFKPEQLNWVYEFLIKELGLDPNKLYATVFEGDDNAPRDEESIELLKDVFKGYGIETDCADSIYDLEKRIFAYPYDKNWWMRGEQKGELGGPDSEIFYDTGREHNPAFGEKCHVNCDCGRFIEIGNNVFMQYIKGDSGWEKMGSVNVDFGGGLERLAMVVNGYDSIFQTTLFQPVIDYLEEKSGFKYLQDTDYDKAFESVADHVRGAVFLLAENIVPSNKEQGYYLRRLIRRLITFARYFKLENGYTKELADIIINTMGGYYKHLPANREFVLEQIYKEEKLFAKTLNKGLKEFAKIVEKTTGEVIVGEDAFKLLDTYGFPLEMTEELAIEKNLKIDQAGFDQAFKVHQEVSRAGMEKKFKGGLADNSEQTVNYHTTAHLLLAALRNVLGDHVTQRGANITGERLRFDFSNPAKLETEQKQAVEEMINGWIQGGATVTWEEMSLEDTRAKGIVGSFEDKYADMVKVYTIADKDGNALSCEICGGPHVEKIDDLGEFKIKKEQSSSAGVRRIKAVLV